MGRSHSKVQQQYRGRGCAATAACLPHSVVHALQCIRFARLPTQWLKVVVHDPNQRCWSTLDCSHYSSIARMHLLQMALHYMPGSAIEAFSYRCIRY